MNEREYVKKVLKRISLDKKTKARIEEDLLQDIYSAQEDGETWESIQKRMGTPEQVAQEYCSQMGCSMRKKRKWPWIILIVIIILVIGIWLCIPKNHPIQTSEYFDEQEVLHWNEHVVNNLSSGNIKDLLTDSTEQFQNEITEEELLSYYEELNTGEFVRISQIQSTESRSILQGVHAVSEVTDQYENHSVIYIISFDTHGKLAGLYMR